MAGHCDFDHRIGGKCRTGGDPGPDERAIADLAIRQHGVVSRRQLLALGFGRRAIDQRIKRGRLHPVHRGIYAVGYPGLSGHGHWLAAVLASGPGALLSHRSAAALWGFLRVPAGRIDVTARAGRGRGRPGIHLHRARELHHDDCTSHNSIPVTAVARTLLDLAEELHPRRLERAFEEAERLRILDLRALQALVERSRGRRGLRSLMPLLSVGRDPANTRSELERRFVELCREAGLAQPVLNTMVDGFEVDALWPGQRVVVELDGYSFHHTRNAFERDRVRDASLQLAGYRVVRITWRRMEGDARATVEMLRQFLA